MIAVALRVAAFMQNFEGSAPPKCFGQRQDVLTITNDFTIIACSNLLLTILLVIRLVVFS